MHIRECAFMRNEGWAALGQRSGSTRNYGYGPLQATALKDFDFVLFISEVSYARGAPPLPEMQHGDPEEGAGAG
jgi:hypothetical protein